MRAMAAAATLAVFLKLLKGAFDFRFPMMEIPNAIRDWSQVDSSSAHDLHAGVRAHKDRCGADVVDVMPKPEHVGGMQAWVSVRRIQDILMQVSSVSFCQRTSPHQLLAAAGCRRGRLKPNGGM